MRYFGIALRLRWEWLRRSDPSRSWAALPAKADKHVQAMSAASISVVVGDGLSTKLWTDNWTTVGPLCHFAPALYAAASRHCKRLSVKDGLLNNRWASGIVGALTTPVLCQFLRVWELLRQVQLNPLASDRFIWKWSTDGSYSASSAYRAFFYGSIELPGARELWRVKAPPRVKFFFWLALHRRLWTAERRKRHGLQDDDACVLCCQEPEDADHLLLGCVVARQLWFALLSPLGWASIQASTEDTLIQWWLRSRGSLPMDSRPMFDAVTFLISWSIWKERNGRTFNGVSRSFRDLVFDVLHEADVWVSAGFLPLGEALTRWSHLSAAL